jgi:hypothetical protein
MIPVHVDRWRSRYVARQPLDAEQVRTWDGALAQLELGRALPMTIADDEWICIRSLTLRSRLFAGDGASQAADAWGQSFAASLAELLRNPPPDTVVRYRTRRDALADMLYRSAMGDLRHAWAWRQLGVAAALTEAPALLREAARQLAADPLALWPVLARLLLADEATGAFTALVRHLAADDWDVLLDACPQTRAFQRAAEQPGASDPVPPPHGELHNALVAWISQHPWQARSRRRPIIVLLAAASSPGGLPEAGTAARLARARGELDRIVQPGPSAARAAPRPVDAAGALRNADPSGADESATDAEDDSARQIGHEPRDAAALLADPAANAAGPEPTPLVTPELPPIATHAVTAWAGLLYLTNLVPETGLLEACDGDEPLSVTRVLRLIAVEQFGVPEADPAVAAFCGGERSWGEPEPGPSLERLRALAAATAPALRDRLVARLGLDPDVAGPTIIEAVCRRPGSILIEPGWIEVHMAMRDAEASIRRAALDLDPGWVAWLGCVVRFVYE